MPKFQQKYPPITSLLTMSAATGKLGGKMAAVLDADKRVNAAGAVTEAPPEDAAWQPETTAHAAASDTADRDWMAAGSGIKQDREPEPEHLELGTIGTSQYAEAIADLLSRADGEVALALFGDWGIGKTTLARAIERELTNETTAPTKYGRLYEIVWFSAWQYRKPPETWIFLYVIFVRRYLRRTLNLWQRLARMLRVGTARHGVLNLVLQLCGLGVALMVASLATAIASLTANPLAVGLGAVGSFAGAVAVIFPTIWKRARNPAKRLASRYAVLATHADQLGMQATIGDDMRALLRAWLPTGEAEGSFWKKVWAVCSARLWDVVSPPSEPDAATPTFALPLIQLGALLTLFISAAWLAGVCILPDLVHRVASGSLLLLWTGLCVLCGVALMQRPAKANRILLVVDDLDRCDPGDAMTIIEAVKLLLDDKEMQNRVQVLMLADERTFALATAAKFDRLIAERAAAIERNAGPSDKKLSASEHAQAQVIREHREKLFLCHLRLGPLNAEEAADLGKQFSRPNTPQAQPASSDNKGQQIGKPAKPAEAMTETEAGLVKDRLGKIVHCRSITPRNIRSIILRYQLARNLVRAGKNESPQRDELERILDLLVASTFEDVPVGFGQVPARRTIPYVVAQVS